MMQAHITKLLHQIASYVTGVPVPVSTDLYYNIDLLWMMHTIFSNNGREFYFPQLQRVPGLIGRRLTLEIYFLIAYVWLAYLLIF